MMNPRDHVTLDSGRGKRRLETTKVKGLLKGVFKSQGCWGLPQQLLATSGCLGSFKDKGLNKGARTQE